MHAMGSLILHWPNYRSNFKWS